MVDFAISDDARLIIETVRRFVAEELVPHEDLVEEKGEVPPELVDQIRKKSKELGLFGMMLPEDAGGAGLSAVDACLVEEQFGRTSDALVRRAFGAIPGPLLFCNADQRKRYLEPAMAGEINVSFALTEPEAGSDAASIRTTAVRDGNDYIINGVKHFITDADIAHTAIVTAVTDPSQGSKGISTFLLDRTMPGFRFGRVQHMMGMRGLNHGELFFENIRVGPEQLLGQEGKGMFHVMSFLNRVRLGGVGARAVGMARRILELCIDHANQRVQFGKTIGEYQMIQQKLADMAADIYGARMMVLNAAWEVDQGHDPREKVSIVKFAATEMLGRVADHGVQIFGGMGYSKEMPMERFYRDARVLRIYDGTSEVHRMVVARSLLKNGMFDI